MNKIANEVEIVITSKNRARPAVEEAKRDAKGLERSYKDVGKTGTTAFGQIRDALRGGLHDSIAGVHGDTNRLSRAFRQVQVDVTRGLDRAKTAIKGKLLGENDGRSMGRRLMSGITDAVKSGSGLLSSAFRGTLKTAFSTPMVVGVLLAALGGVAAVLGPALATLISGGLVLGVGSALAGVGAMALFHVEKINKDWSKAEQKRVTESNKQAEKLRHQFLELGRDVIGGLKAAAQPLIPVLDTVRSTVRNVGREFQPVIEQSFKIVKGPLQRFVKNLGEAFIELKPALVPIMTTFGELLDEIGPMLPGLFAQISDALIDLAGTVSENKDLFALIFVALLQSIPAVIGFLSTLTSVFRSTLVAALGFADGVLAVFQAIMEAAAAIPGPWQDSAAAMAASIQDTRSKLGGFRADVENFPKIVKLEGDIRDLDRKLASARKQLRDPNLTKTRRAKLEARIEQLLAAKRRAQAAIDSMRGKTVTITVNTLHRTNGPPMTARAHGGIIGGLGARRFAQGGIAGSGSSLALVGEQGPELVRLPFGSGVTSAGQTRAAMNPAMSGFNSVSMAFRQATGSGGGDLAGSMRDLTKALRDVIGLREGMSRFTDSVFGGQRALMAYEAAWDQIRKSVKENGRTISIGTAKGRENRGALLGLAEAAHEVAFAMRDLGKPTSQIVAKMAEQRKEFIRAARTMGLTSAQAKKLADYYGLIPSKVKTVLTTESKDLAYNKKAEAYNKKVTGGKATGGIAGGWTLVGERGAELVRLPFGSSVTPAGQTAAMMAGGGGGRTVLEIRSGGSRMDDLIVEIVRRAVRVHGGGSVQTALGRR